MWSVTLLFPVAVVVCLAYGLRSSAGWRAGILTACAIAGMLVVLLTESLSMVHALSRGPLVLSWAVAAVASGWWAARRRGSVSQNATRLWFSPERQVLWAAITIILALTLTTALAAPPNTWDSLIYHMARVAHWTQNRSVAPYPTHNLRQLHQGPFAEFAVLHSQVLSGTDRFANLIQWAAVLVTAIAVSLIAKQLGVGRRGQLLAALVWIATPMAVTQASTTQNDAVTALWLAAFVALAMRDDGERPGSESVVRLIVLGACLGLAALTKPTAYFFGLPLVVWFVASRIRTGRGNLLRACGILFGVALLLNLGFFARNVRVEGSPLGSGVEGVNGTYAYANESHSAGAVISNVVRNIALHLATRSEDVDARTEAVLVGGMQRMGIDPNDPRTTWTGEEFHVRFCGSEDCIGNPLQLILAAICLAIVFVPLSRSLHAERALAACVIVSFVLFCVALKWQPWHSRLHLPLFALSAPLVAGIVDRWSPDWTVSALAIALVMAALPIALLDPLRPLVGPRSLFRVGRDSSYVAGRPAIAPPLLSAERTIVDRNCAQVGLVSGANAPEYMLWVFGKRGQTPLPRIEHVGVSNASAFLAAREPYRSFDPCAVVTFDTSTGPELIIGRTFFLRADSTVTNPQLYLPRR